MSERPEWATFESQAYDFATGEHCSKFLIQSPAGAIRDEPFHMFNESASILEGSRDDTVLLTNPAGYLMGLLMGLPGIRLHSGDPGTWFERDVVLPDGWKDIAVERLFVRGEERELVARHGKRAQWV